MGRRASRETDLVELCGPLLQQLSAQTGETVMLTGYDARRAKVVCLEQIPSVKEGLRVFERIGAAFALYRGASSKAVLAFLGPQEIERLLAAMPRDEPGIEVDRLRDDLKDIRSSGLATSIEETYPGVAGLAVPVLAADGCPLGSIAVAGPIVRMDPNARSTIGKLLTAASRTLAESLAKSP